MVRGRADLSRHVAESGRGEAFQLAGEEGPEGYSRLRLYTPQDGLRTSPRHANRSKAVGYSWIRFSIHTMTKHIHSNAQACSIEETIIS